MLSFLSVPRVRHVSLKSYRWSGVPELVHMVSLVLQMIPLSVPAVVSGPALVNLIHCMVSLVLWFVPPGFPELAHGASCVPRQSAVAVRDSGHCGTASAAIVFTELLPQSSLVLPKLTEPTTIAPMYLRLCVRW